MNQKYEEILEQAGIRLTATRLLVLQTLHETVQGTFSFSDILEKMPYMDESSVYRTLTLFAENHILHHVDDGSGKQKYCLCRCELKKGGHELHHRGHVHLTCIKCHKTICLDNIMIPQVPIPDTFTVVESEYVIKGLCEKCGKKLLPATKGRN